MRKLTPHESQSTTPLAPRTAPTLAGIVVAMCVTACPSYVVIPDRDRQEVERAHTGELLWLAQSVYAGQFYDDDRFRLVHPRRFEELTYLTTVEGDPLPPPPAVEVIPAGTRVRIERIEWPTGDVVFRRPLLTPRYTPWVFLRVARERGDVTIERDERHILLLPGGIRDRAIFDAWLEASLSTTDPNPWLLSLSEEHRLAIFGKRVVVGMTHRALIAAFGFPDRVEALAIADAKAGQKNERAFYGPTVVDLSDGVVVGVSTDAG